MKLAIQKDWRRIRKPLPPKPGRPLTTKKGRKGYDRNSFKRETKRKIEEELGIFL